MKRNNSFNLFIIFTSLLFILITTMGSLITIIQYTSYQGEDIVEKYSINFIGLWKKTIKPTSAEYPGQYDSERGIYQDFGLDYIPFPYYGSILILVGFLIIIISSIFSIFLKYKHKVWIQITLLIGGTILTTIGLLTILLFGFEMFEPFISQIYIRTEEVSIDFGFSLRFGWGYLILCLSPLLNILYIIGLFLFGTQRDTIETNELTKVSRNPNL